MNITENMPIYKSGLDRFKKYSAKYVPETVSARFTQVKDVALERAQEGLILFEAVQSIVRPVLDKYGIAGPDRGKYIGFANKVLRHLLRAKGESAKRIASGLKSYYVEAYNADPSVLDEIITLVAGWVVPY